MVQAPHLLQGVPVEPSDSAEYIATAEASRSTG